jgi:hypothetical protein
MMDDIDRKYDYWRAALAGQKPKPVVDQPELGFYRKGLYERNDKGNKRRVGWEPVALWMNGTTLILTHLGGDTSVRDRINEAWSYCCDNPISEETYRAVAERGEPWPDERAPVPAANREVTAVDNNPPEVLTDADYATAIDAAIGAALKTVASEEEAAQALGSKNRIAELRLAADKAGKAIYDPMYRVYTAEQKKWSPIIARAAAKEKELNTAILTFREKERQRIALEQAQAEAKQHEIDEANERAAQRSIAAGLPEEAPEIIEIEKPAAPAPLVPTYGTRSVKEQLHTILDAVTDYDAVYTFLKAEPKVKALLLELATAKVKAGFTVPGTTTREGLI